MYAAYQGPTFFEYSHPTDGPLIAQWAVSSLGMVMVFEGLIHFTKVGKAAPVRKSFPAEKRVGLYFASACIGWFVGKHCLPPPAPLAMGPKPTEQDKATATTTIAQTDATPKQR